MSNLRSKHLLSVLFLMICTVAGAVSVPASAAAPTPTARPTTKPNIETCKPYPSPTPLKPTPTTKGAPTQVIEPTGTPEPTRTSLPPTATPTLSGTPTTIPTGKKPADMLITLRYSQTLQRAGKACLEVYSVEPYGPADRAGLRAGDIILSVEKVSTTEIADFFSEISRRSAGDTVNVTVQRASDALIIPVLLGLNPFADPNAATTPLPTPKTGSNWKS